MRAHRDMGYTFSLAHLTANLCSPQQLIEVAARAGYDHVSLRMTPVTKTEQIHPLIDNPPMMKETVKRLADTDLDVLDVELIRMNSETGPEAYRSFLDAAAELGARAVICQLPDPNRERASEKFARLCDLALPYNLVIALEFVSWTDTADLGAARSIIEQSDRQNGGLLVDTLHFARSGSALEELENIPHSWFSFIHLCDAAGSSPGSRMASIHTARRNRLFPGKGQLQLRDMLSRMPIVPYSLEIPNSVLIKKYGLATYCSMALETTKKYLSDETLGPLHPGDGKAGRPAVAAVTKSVKAVKQRIGAK